MKQQVNKRVKIALCRRCGGTGYITPSDTDTDAELCTQCLGSGRVTVSARMELDIRPYQPIKRTI